MLAFLANAAIYVVPFLIVITVIVTMHELGHFLTARAFGVAVDRFSIGFGRAIVSFKDRWGVEWRIAWLPLGGYVKFAGDENAASVPDQDDLDGLRRAIVAARRRRRRATLLLSSSRCGSGRWWSSPGPAANFVLVDRAVRASCSGRSASRSPRARSLDVDPGARRPRCWLQAGRRHHRGGRSRASRTLRGSGATTCRTAVGMPMLTSPSSAPASPLASTADAGRHQVEQNLAGGGHQVGQLGVAARCRPCGDHYDPLQAVGRGAGMTWTIVETHRLLRRPHGRRAGRAGRCTASSAPPTSPASLTKEAVQHRRRPSHMSLGADARSLQYMSVWRALISVSIGLVNLLPIPVLDGGHLLFYAYEAVARRPLRSQLQAAGYRVGLALLVGLMLFATWNDLQRLQVFHFLRSCFPKSQSHRLVMTQPMTKSRARYAALFSGVALCRGRRRWSARLACGCACPGSSRAASSGASSCRATSASSRTPSSPTCRSRSATRSTRPSSTWR